VQVGGWVTGGMEERSQENTHLRVPGDIGKPEERPTLSKEKKGIMFGGGRLTAATQRKDKMRKRERRGKWVLCVE